MNLFGVRTIEFPIDQVSLQEAIDAVTVGTWGWFYQWGMFIFLLVALACLAWVFIDSTQKRKGSKALVSRILSIVGVLLVLPAFLFRFTGNVDGVDVQVLLTADKQLPGGVYVQPVAWNVSWLVNGYGPTLALLALLGLALAVLAAIIYASTASRSRPSTEFVNALNNQFGQIRQEIQATRPASAPAAGAAAAVAAEPRRSAATVMGGGAPNRSAPTIIGEPAQPGFAELWAVSGGTVGQRWQLPTVDVKIGRETTNLVSIDDERSSREHAKIRFADGVYTIIDLGSSNGTLVNDQPVMAPTRLNDGDTIKIGSTVLTFKTTK
ncbi:MAG: FHA domain-containing protein [Candidatus Bipolaricaulia bacterium]